MTDATSREEQLARGIAAMGRVARDADGFTVYATGAMPDAFRVWDDPHAGVRCSCEGFSKEFATGGDYRCEHILAVELTLAPPEEEIGPVETIEPRRKARRIV